MAIERAVEATAHPHNEATTDARILHKAPTVRQPERPPLDGFDREMLMFVLRWMPYGGPPADQILPSFGILACELADRIREIAGKTPGRLIPLADHLLLRRALAAADAIDKRELVDVRTSRPRS